MSKMFTDSLDWRLDVVPDMLAEQEEDGIVDAFRDFRIWFETRKSRAKIHLRMVAKLLYWHRQSVEKLWDPHNPLNRDRIMSIM